jgi:hypothetical protein
MKCSSLLETLLAVSACDLQRPLRVRAAPLDVRNGSKADIAANVWNGCSRTFRRLVAPDLSSDNCLTVESDIIARAYQLASECSCLKQVRSKLKREGYANVDGHLSSRQLRAELKLLLKPKGS